MLKFAYQYKDKLEKQYAEITNDDKYKYLFPGGYIDFTLGIKDNNWDQFQMVSVDSNDNILGYFRAGIDRAANKVTGLSILNFHAKSITFSKDFRQFLSDLLYKYNFRKISFCMVVGNPIEEQYDRMVAKYGGRIVGIEKQEALINGTLKDLKLYEIFKENKCN